MFIHGNIGMVEIVGESGSDIKIPKSKLGHYRNFCFFVPPNKSTHRTLILPES